MRVAKLNISRRTTHYKSNRRQSLNPPCLSLHCLPTAGSYIVFYIAFYVYLHTTSKSAKFVLSLSFPQYVAVEYSPYLNTSYCSVFLCLNCLLLLYFLSMCLCSVTLWQLALFYSVLLLSQNTPSSNYNVIYRAQSEFSLHKGWLRTRIYCNILQLHVVTEL